MVNYYYWKPSNLQNILPAGSSAGPPPAFSSSEQSGSGNSSCSCSWCLVVVSVKVRDRLTSCSTLHPYKAMWGQPRPASPLGIPGQSELHPEIPRISWQYSVGAEYVHQRPMAMGDAKAGRNSENWWCHRTEHRIGGELIDTELNNLQEIPMKNTYDNKFPLG